jgi:predicted branched-subunit amino acid permease
MSTETENGLRTRNGTQSVRTNIVTELSAGFWTSWLLAAIAGEMAGQILYHVYPHRSGRVIIALLMCFLATSILQGASRRLPRMMFWSAALSLSLLGAVLARTTDISMGGGDIGAWRSS